MATCVCLPDEINTSLQPRLKSSKRGQTNSSPLFFFHTFLSFSPYLTGSREYVYGGELQELDPGLPPLFLAVAQQQLVRLVHRDDAADALISDDLTNLNKNNSKL